MQIRGLGRCNAKDSQVALTAIGIPKHSPTSVVRLENGAVLRAKWEATYVCAGQHDAVAQIDTGSQANCPNMVPEWKGFFRRDLGGNHAIKALLLLDEGLIFGADAVPFDRHVGNYGKERY